MAVSTFVSRGSSQRQYSSSQRYLEQPLSSPSRVLTPRADDEKEPVDGSPKTVLQNGSLIRKIVPSTVWIPKPDRAPGQDVSGRTAHYIHKINPDALLSILRSIPRVSQEPSKGVPRVSLSDAALKELMPEGKKENTWRHYDGSSCLIKVRRKHAELYGSVRAREIAQTYLSDTRLYTRSQEHLDWHARASHGSYLAIEALPCPPTWTVRSFSDYVNIVTRPRFRRSAQRTIYDEDDSHQRAVLRILQNLFTDSTTAPFISTDALRQALSYCRRHTESPTTADHLWKALLNTGIHPDISCFNEELGRCLVGKEFTRLSKTVLDMKQLGVIPDSMTWAIVTAYTQRQSSRAEILQLARMTSLPNAGIQEWLIVAVVKKEIPAYLSSPGGIKRFMKQMKDRFGSNWLTSRVLERMLRACRVGSAKVLPASEILSALREAGKFNLISQRCAIELIHISKKAGNLRDAVELAKYEALSPIADIPQTVIDLLFSMAWQARYFNVCRFMWFLGATSGRITFRMQGLVTKSLRSNTSRLEDPTEASWQLLAGKIIIGTNLDTEGFGEMFPLLSKSEMQSTPVEWILNYTSDGALRIEQIHLGQLLVEKDLNAFRFYERPPKDQFVSLLDEALKLDEEWKAHNAATTVSPRDLIRRSLKIPLRKREEALEYQGGSTKKELQRRWFVVNGHNVDMNTLKYDATQQVGVEGDQVQGTLQITDDRMMDKVSTDDEDSGQLLSSGDGGHNPIVPGQDCAEPEVEEQRVVWQGFG